MLLTINIKSKNNKSIFKCFLILSFLFNNSNVIIKIVNYQKNKLIKFTLLKSPHINKTAQSWFNYNIYSTKVKLIIIDIEKLIFNFKYILKILFHDIYISINYLYINNRIFTFDYILINIKSNNIRSNLYYFNNINIYMHIFKTLFNIKIQNLNILKANNSVVEYPSDKRNANSSILF